jgi:hypothetical protein
MEMSSQLYLAFGSAEMFLGEITVKFADQVLYKQATFRSFPSLKVNRTQEQVLVSAVHVCLFVDFTKGVL